MSEPIIVISQSALRALIREEVQAALKRCAASAGPGMHRAEAGKDEAKDIVLTPGRAGKTEGEKNKVNLGLHLQK